MKKLNLGGGYSIAYKNVEDEAGNEHAYLEICKNSNPVGIEEASRIWGLFYGRIADFIQEHSPDKWLDDPEDKF